MRSAILLSGLACLVGIGSATEAISEKRAFSVPHNRPNPEVTYDGPEALRKAYLKHGLELPPHLRARRIVRRQAPSRLIRRIDQGSTASVPADSKQNDLEYLSPVVIDGRTLSLNFDTGSSDLWVFSDHLPENQRRGHSYYVANANSASLKPGFSWKILYGDGSGASGVVYADKVQVGGATATAQAVEAATSISSEFVNEHSDGLLGLGFGHTNTIKPEAQPTFFESIKGSLKAPLFTATLKKNQSGTYDFGYIDSKKYTGSLQYAPVNTSRGYWEYTLTGFSVGNDPSPTSVKYQSIADTGTTLFLLPSKVVDAYYKQVSGAKDVASEGGYVFPCNSNLPDMTVYIGQSDGGQSIKVQVPGQFMNRSLSDTGSGLCYGGIQKSSDGLSIWGDVFLKSQFVVFDGSSPPRIGFAKQADGSVTSIVQNAMTPAGSAAAAATTALKGQQQEQQQSGKAKPTPVAAGRGGRVRPPWLSARFLSDLTSRWLASGGRRTSFGGAIPRGRRVY